MIDHTALPQPPADWPEETRSAFWAAVNASTYAESAAATLVFAHELAEMVRADVDLGEHPGESVYECEGCATVRAAAAIDPETAS
ncbi:hypothetical protein ACFVOB_28230 [Streptomyces rochei]|uniref:hypothetical protein n=1 Tax=Streptomyces rochei TaxID=1928 RepID=UPI00367790ED